ncbi:hypothetical protein BDQ12DRAFT_318211 [Crucibulum laeve]|uniref:Uncharacterized protein n=1 Tax=Crucibulum laeve TaxID=68775 RepID=A0A5C3LSA8_9AGAR|nr:hypothetical protein BDQ12DRAFT_318211 [Crucibulum laeve]
MILRHHPLANCLTFVHQAVRPFSSGSAKRISIRMVGTRLVDTGIEGGRCHLESVSLQSPTPRSAFSAFELLTGPPSTTRAHTGFFRAITAVGRRVHKRSSVPSAVLLQHLGNLHYFRWPWDGAATPLQWFCGITATRRGMLCGTVFCKATLWLSRQLFHLIDSNLSLPPLHSTITISQHLHIRTHGPTLYLTREKNEETEPAANLVYCMYAGSYLAQFHFPPFYRITRRLILSWLSPHGRGSAVEEGCRPFTSCKERYQEGMSVRLPPYGLTYPLFICLLLIPAYFHFPGSILVHQPHSAFPLRWIREWLDSVRCSHDTFMFIYLSSFFYVVL